MKSWVTRASITLATLVVIGAAIVSPVGAEALTTIILNGKTTTGYFNDGDTFRPRDGQYHGQSFRTGGFNTLESFGPVHQWGDWHPYELYVIAKLAARNARRGTWHCSSDGTADGYGRMLADCPDLAYSQIEHGFAMAYQADDSPARPEYLRAEREAIAAHRGMWAHGVPEFVMTSVHSADEDRDRSVHYNRLISTLDGHTEEMRHTDSYGSCEWVCARETAPDPTTTHDVARSLREDTALAPLIADLSNVLLLEMTGRFARTGDLPAWVSGTLRDEVRTRLIAARDAGRIGPVHEQRGSCMLYVPFDQRYSGRGGAVAPCLAGHGTLPPDLPDHWHGAH
jgi:endonuclease YncB( thermonuclease family)